MPVPKRDLLHSANANRVLSPQSVSETQTPADMADAAMKKDLAGIAAKKSEAVRVVVRVRPLSKKELQDGREPAAIVDESRGEIALRNPKADEREAPKMFTFDQTYGPNSSQRQIYDLTASPIVDSVLQGFNGTIFAYGQTGAGKTHTMEGKPDPPEMRGIIPNSFKHIFDHINTDENKSHQYLVRVSYLEIYNEEIRDLLARDPKNRLELHESIDTGVYVKDLTTFVTKSSAEIDTVMQAGNKNRSVGATLMNQTSSRSHSIFTVTVESSIEGDDGEAHIKVGKLNMVDLAGSERQSKTGATGDRLKEATKINLSLSALGNVISALVDGKTSYIPYRDSKLTRLLQDSLGGNTKTVMIANCGPADYNYDEIVSTLRYANRAKRIKNKPKVNEDPKDAMLRQYQEEIERLRQKLAAAESSTGGGGPQTIMVDGKEMEVPADALQPKVIEKEVVVEKLVGVSEEEVQRLKAEAEQKQQELQHLAEVERTQLLQNMAQTEEEREALRAKLEELDRARAVESKQQEALKKKIKAMQEKLLIGGQVIDNAAKQEEELRRTRVELEERRAQEMKLARELEEKEFVIEEQHTSMQEELESKTKKLKKVWTKWQAAQAEIRDLQEEFQREKDDMLGAVRDVTSQNKLYHAIMQHFLPTEEVEKLQRRAKWDEATSEWHIPHASLTGNMFQKSRRPRGDTAGRRAETQYGRTRAQLDNDPRYRVENVATLQLELPDRTTQDYGEAAISERVQQALREALQSDEDDMLLMADSADQNPYLNYTDDGPGYTAAASKPSRSSTAAASRKKHSSKQRPGTASRRRRPESASRRGGGAEEYPAARGLVQRD